MRNKYRDVFGELEFSIGEFFVPHRTGGTGKYTILKREPWRVTAPVIMGEHNLWDDVPVFDSFIQAVRFLKEHYTELV